MSLFNRVLFWGMPLALVLGVVFFLVSVTAEIADKGVFSQRLAYGLNLTKILDTSLSEEVELGECVECNITSVEVVSETQFVVFGINPNGSIEFKKEEVDGSYQWVCLSRPHNFSYLACQSAKEYKGIWSLD